MTQLLAKSHSSNFTNLIRRYSQPINPAWLSRGSPEERTRRTEIQNKPWSELPSSIQDLVVGWARGQISNPVPRAVDFAVPAVASTHPFPGGVPQGSLGLSSRGFEIVYDSQNRGPDSTDHRGNVFYSKPESRQWPERFVTILYNGVTTQEINPSSIPQSSTSQSTTSSQSEDVANEIFERNFAMTADRTEPPSDHHYGYFTLSSSLEDPQTDNILTQQEEETLTRTNHSRFYDQIIALKQKSSLDVSSIVPTITIWGSDGEGHIENLSEAIFNQSSIHNLIDDNSSFQTLANAEFPDRPLASVEQLTLTIQTPSVGGVAEITVARLSLVVHNPSLVSINHPKGKYIEYLLRQGYTIRIRYGFASDETTDTQAFQWKEQDFFVSQHEITINEDKTANITISLLPATQKLMNQILIGESIPVENIGSITDQDINQSIDSIVSGGDLPQEQVDEIRRMVRNFSNQFNAIAESPAMRIQKGDDGSFGSVLHGAILNSQIIKNESEVAPIVIENFISCLRSIQSLLLTRRYQMILNEDAYRYTLVGTEINAVNFGPLFWNLAKPEIDSIARWVSQHDIRIGETFSVDYISNEDENRRRTNVQVIFGNFNRRAGQWSNKPISSFPINIDSIFSHLRQRRNLGEFSSHINGFLNTINGIINERSNYVPERTDGGDISYPLEVPQIRYSFFADPRNDRMDNWIFYIYDSKVPFVDFREVLDGLNGGQSLSKQEIVEQLENHRIPYIEKGVENDFIKTLNANTQADDLLQTHNMIQANRDQIGLRQTESGEIPAGVSREWIDGSGHDPNEVIRNVTYIMPIQVSMTFLLLSSAVLFAPIYIFWPIERYSGLYMPYVLEHNITNSEAISKMNLQINLTRANRRSS
jgi:hypothetical protein